MRGAHRPAPRGWLDRRIAANGHLVHKLKAKDATGRWAFYFVFVQPWREKAFLQALATSASLDLEEYGQVIAANYGEEPSEATRALLRSRYGFEV